MTDIVTMIVGDRTEALAAACAATVHGSRIAHVHGGDRATGDADDSIRHAITKLAHIHFPAGDEAARRLVNLGEDPARIHITGTPATDDLDQFPPLADDEYDALGRPGIILLFHPCGSIAEAAVVTAVYAACARHRQTLPLAPNHDRGRETVHTALRMAAGRVVDHLPRRTFVGLLKRGAVLVGNSSAAYIEAAALGVPCLDIAPRQDGRTRTDNIIRLQPSDLHLLDDTIAATLSHRPARTRAGKPAGQRIAWILATHDIDRHQFRKRVTF